MQIQVPGLIFRKAYEPEIYTFITGLGTALSSYELDLMNNLLKYYKTNLSITSLSDYFDIFYIISCETVESSYRNLVKRSHDAVKYGTATHTVNEGINFDEASYLDTNYNPYTQGVVYTLTNASMGVYHRTDSGAGLYVSMGSRTSLNDYTVLLPHYTGDIATHRMHQQTCNVVNGTMTDAKGLNVVTRNDGTATGLYGYYNKTTLARTATTCNVNNIPNCNIFIGARNFAGTPEGHTNRQTSLGFAGKYISESARDVIYDGFQTYMTEKGKQV